MGESRLGQEVDLGRACPETQEVVKEEVVQLVGSNQVFGLLLDVAHLVSRYQLWADRCVDNVEQRLARGCVYLVVGHPLH